MIERLRLWYCRSEPREGSQFPVLPEARPFGDFGGRHGRKGLGLLMSMLGLLERTWWLKSTESRFPLMVLVATASEINVQVSPAIRK